jgi:hypothetical protein
MPDSQLLNALATAFLAGEPAVERIVEHCGVTLGRRVLRTHYLSG